MGTPYEMRDQLDAERRRPQPVLVLQTMADVVAFVALIRNEPMEKLAVAVRALDAETNKLQEALSDASIPRPPLPRRT